jgi:addiction module HigA family antidote
MLKKEMPPVHPGEILKEMYMEPLGIGVGQLAETLHVARKTISQIINKRANISVEMSLRLSKAFDTTPELWLNMQRSYDLWEAGKRLSLNNIPHLVTRRRRA